MSNTDLYKVNSDSKKWAQIDGYSCFSKNIGNMLSHLSWRFKSIYTLPELKKGYLNNEIKFTIIPARKIEPYGVSYINKYFNDYGYQVDVCITGNREKLYQEMIFATEVEADEWIKTQNLHML